MNIIKKNTESSEILKHKRERNVNFTPQETELLVSLAQRKRYIIENKKSDATTWQAKEKTWNDIAKAFNNASSFVHRSSKTLKLKYEALKRDTRKKAATAQIPLTPVELKVKKIIFDSIESNGSLYDSDLVVPSRSNYSGTSASDSFITQLHTEEQNVQSDDTNKNYIEFQSIKSEFPEENDFEESQEEESQQCSSGNIIENQSNNIELPIENVCEETQEEGLQQCKPKQKRGFHKLIQKKIELVNLQKQLVIEEMEQKLIQRRILETELVHKNDIYNLEKQHLLLKIELLKKDLENNK